MRLARETLADRLLAQLRQQVMTGRVAPGQAMPTEQQLCEAFGVGRSTVREAVSTLAHLGMLEANRSFGTVVRSRSAIPTTMRDFTGGYDEREVTEALAAVEAALSSRPGNRLLADLCQGLAARR